MPRFLAHYWPVFVTLVFMNDSPSRVGRPVAIDVTDIREAALSAPGEWTKVTGCTTGEARSIKRQLEREGMKVSISKARTNHPIVFVRP